MQITTYYVSHETAIDDIEAKALVHLINDNGMGNGDNRSFNAMRARVDAMLDAETQRRFGIRIEAEQAETAMDD